MRNREQVADEYGNYTISLNRVILYFFFLFFFNFVRVYFERFAVEKTGPFAKKSLGKLQRAKSLVLIESSQFSLRIFRTS